MPRLSPKLSQAVLTAEQNASIGAYAVNGELGAIVGRGLAQAETEALTSLARRYMLARAIELESPTVQQAKLRLSEARAAAGALRAALSSADPYNTAFLIGKLINEQLRGRTLSRGITGRVDATRLAFLMKDLEQACDKAQEFAASNRESKAWQSLIRELDAWAGGIGLRTTVSKRLQGKSAPLPPSTYLLLVQTLLDSMPADLRQHRHAMVTDSALAQAIHRARDTKRGHGG